MGVGSRDRWEPTPRDWIELSKAKIGPAGAFKRIAMPKRKLRRLRAKMARAKNWTKDGVPMALAGARPGEERWQ